MAAAKYDIIIQEGASLALTLVYKDSAGTPIDISGSTSSIDIIDNALDSVADTFAGSFTTDGTDGSFEIALTAAQVSALGFANGRYTISLAGSPADTLLYGKFLVKPLKY